MLTNNIDESQAILVVIPSDIGAYKRKGQKEGAKRIHKLIKKMTFAAEIADYGELFLNHFSLKKTHETIENEIKKIKDYGKPLIIIGGDHSISYGCMKNFPEAQIYLFDAHPDLIKEEGIITHGSFMQHFKNRSKIIGKRFKTKQEAEELITLGEIETDKAYVSIDLDVLDPSIMPGVSHPVSGGWSLEQLKNEISKVSDRKKVVCIDIVEFSSIVETTKSIKAIEDLLRFVFQKFLNE
jgi:agmatinase